MIFGEYRLTAECARRTKAIENFRHDPELRALMLKHGLELRATGGERSTRQGWFKILIQKPTVEITK